MVDNGAMNTNTSRSLRDSLNPPIMPDVKVPYIFDRSYGPHVFSEFFSQRRKAQAWVETLALAWLRFEFGLGCVDSLSNVIC